MLLLPQRYNGLLSFRMGLPKGSSPVGRTKTNMTFINKPQYLTPAGWLHACDAQLIYIELNKLADKLSDLASARNDTPKHSGLMEAYNQTIAYAEYFNPEKLIHLPDDKKTK